jgi:hypothetical protein
MGIFSSTKKTYVSSVVYNLAGPAEGRPDYLKSVVLGSVLTKKNLRMGSVVKDAYIGGVGLRLRGYHRWSRENYKQIGISRDNFTGKPNFNSELVRAAMAADFKITASIDWIDSGRADIAMWGRQWMRENMPDKEPLNVWRVDYVEDTSEAFIVFTDGTPTVLFEPLGYRSKGQWLYVSYSRPLTTNRWTTPLLFIYERGTGSASLDTQMLSSTSDGEYLPFIPIRHESKFISESYKPAVYAETKKAYKKAVGAKLDELIDKVKENADIAEIDFAYVFFGVSLNAKDMSSLRYIFSYFTHLIGDHGVNSTTAFNTWAAGQPTKTQDIAVWENWLFDQTANPAGSPVIGTAPPRPTVNGPPSSSVLIQDNGPGQTNLKMELTWNSMTLTTHTGLGKVGAKSGDVWFTFPGSQTIVASAYSNDEVENLTVDTVEMYQQFADNTYKKITVVGMVHTNHIYNGKTVEITAAQALVDEDESGFLVPIHYGVFREMSLIDATQMGSQSMNIVFNSYQIVKKKWYQQGWFAVLIVIVVVVLSIIFPPAGVAAGEVAGLLGTAAGVGAALGFTGLAAIIAGTVANMVAAMILTRLITYASVAVLGEKIGLIVAAIASIVALQVGVALQSGQSMASIWSSLAEPMNLLNMTNSLGNTYSSLVNNDTMSYMEKTKDALDDFRKQSLELQENYAENFGYGTANFDPMALIGGQPEFFTESSEVFLSRTLLTGSEIAQMTQDLITNFAELSLRNEFVEE